jgi:hypothetical protein
MMSVHKAISQHANKQNKIFKEFLALDQEREYYIEEAVTLCKQGRAFSTDKINEVTDKINRLATLRVIPTRKNVTVEMIQEYVKTL